MTSKRSNLSVVLTRAVGRAAAGLVFVAVVAVGPGRAEAQESLDDLTGPWLLFVVGNRGHLEETLTGTGAGSRRMSARRYSRYFLAWE